LASKKDLGEISSDDYFRMADPFGWHHRKLAKTKNSFILASSSSRDDVTTFRKEEGLSTFTHFVIEGLKGKKESVDENGCITPESLSVYVNKEIQKLRETTDANFPLPTRNSHLNADILLADYPKLGKKSQKNE